MSGRWVPRAPRIVLLAAALASLGADGPAAWRPPIGIPAPAFGIAEQAGPPTHVVDRAHPAATDEANPRGTRERPRRTLPSLEGLEPGDVVEIGPGEYRAGRPTLRVNGRGTAERPIFIRGASPAAPPRIQAGLEVYAGRGASFLVIEDLELDGGGDKQAAVEIVARPDAPVDHVVLRSCDLHHGGGVRIYSQGGAVARDIVIFRDRIHDNGDWHAEVDEDVHGVVAGGRSERVWLLDCQLFHNSGDGLQVNPGRLGDRASVNHIYAGRNRAYENKQTGLWSKQAVDVIFSENVVSDHVPIGASPSAWGSAMGYQYGPDRIWFLFNRISSCSHGITGFSSQGGDGEERVYVIGNVIQRIHHHPDYPYRPDDPWSSAAIMLASGRPKFIVNNTISDVDGGIQLPRTGEVHILNNIVSGVGAGSHLALEGKLAPGSELRGNQLDGGEKLRWDGKLAALRVRMAFPARADRGVEPGVYATFRGLYGIDIRVDADGRPRPAGAPFDIGAFERGGRASE